MPQDEEHRFHLTLTREDGYRFRVDFDQEGMGVLLTDEPPPVGGGQGPNPVRLVAAAVGNCLAASLLFCLGKARVETGEVRARVEGTLVRNERGRLRIGELRVVLEPEIASEDRFRIGRCLEVFEDYCMVTESVRRGIDVRVEVEPAVRPPASVP